MAGVIVSLLVAPAPLWMHPLAYVACGLVVMWAWHWPRLPWRRKRWSIVIVGQESGNVTTVDFMRFHTRAEAQKWCDDSNADDGTLTRFEPHLLTNRSEEAGR